MADQMIETLKLSLRSEAKRALKPDLMIQSNA